MHSYDSFRIFGTSVFVTLAATLITLVTLGLGSALIMVILIAVEIAFSFDNAIINAKTLGKLSRFWQMIFLTVGMIIAVLGMRVIFPILIVSLAAHVPWREVIDLALHHPSEYAHHLEAAYPAIAAFGGAFLLMLALEFFIDGERKVMWLHAVEKPLQRIAKMWVPAALSTLAIVVIALVPANHYAGSTLVAGLFGIFTHTIIEVVSNLFGSRTAVAQEKAVVLTGLAAFWAFIYLEVLDASFSFDGVLGAFAVTSNIVLIGASLGVGALWVRSFTVLMVHRGTLDHYIYLEHGAHYTVAVLAFVLLLGVFWHVPEVLAGLVGIGFIGSSIIASRQALQHSRR